MTLRYFLRTIFLLFILSSVRIFSYPSTGCFIIKKTIISNNKKEVEYPGKNLNFMRKLYQTNLYKSFYDVLKIKGFKERDIPRLFCIVKLESSFNQYAKNINTNGTIDAGIFQINSVWKKTCKSSLYNVESNIDCAKVVLERQGLNAWSTYKKYGNICEKSLEILF